ncbi:hypothetical protein [Pedobacter jamesrossensis]|uniref:Uncharacterized protein n=1 Tax=Pedobacter jamesrossensis TaxID=1908238 RepID=A0ABV8NS81_9SPHI
MEKRRFFNQLDYEKIGSLSSSKLAFQLDRGNTLPVSPDFNVKKIDDKNYILTIRNERPEIVFLNYKPIYIEPGDKVKVNYTVILRTFDQLIDTITATGGNKGNYEFAKYNISISSKVKYPELTTNAYKDMTGSFYKDLKHYYQVANNIYDTDPRFKTCSKDLIEYLKRQNSATFLFNLIFFENKLIQEGNRPGAKLLGDSLEYAFNKTIFKPSDTLLNFTMENVFKKYFERVATNKYGDLAIEKNYRLFYGYINNFPDKFIRDYFIMLLVANYRKEVNRYSPELIPNLDKEIANQRVLARTKIIVG